MTKTENHLAGYIARDDVMVEQYKHSRDKEVRIDGYPLFNTCDHHTVDMRHVEGGTEEWQNTVSVLLPNGHAITFCVMDLGHSINVDTKFYGTGETKVLGFKQGETQVFKDMELYALVADKKR
jgi:hypothetical protein